MPLTPSLPFAPYHTRPEGLKGLNPPSRIIWEFPSTNPLLLRGPVVLAVTCQFPGAMLRGTFDPLLWPWHMRFCTGLIAKGPWVTSSATAYFSDKPLVLLPKAVLATCFSSLYTCCKGHKYGELLSLKTVVQSLWLWRKAGRWPERFLCH